MNPKKEVQTLFTSYLLLISIFAIEPERREEVINDPENPFKVAGDKLKSLFKDVDKGIQFYVDEQDKPEGILKLLEMWDDGTITTATIIIAMTEGTNPEEAMEMLGMLTKKAYDNCCYISRKKFNQEFDVDAPRPWYEVVNNPKE